MSLWKNLKNKILSDVDPNNMLLKPKSNTTQQPRYSSLQNTSAPLNTNFSLGSLMKPGAPTVQTPAQSSLGFINMNDMKSRIAQAKSLEAQQQPSNQYTEQASNNQQPFYSQVGGGGFKPSGNYSQQAQQEYDVVYNQQVNTLKNRITNLMAGMEQQKEGINMNYDGAVTNQNRQNTMSQNNYSNETNSRGLGRSSIATTGLGAMDVINNREVANIDSRRTNDLNMVDAQKMALESERENTLGTMEADRANAIAMLARQLEDRDFGKQMQSAEFGMKQAEINNRIKQMNYDHEQAQKQQGGGNGFSQFEFDTYSQYKSQIDGIMGDSKKTSKQKQAELDKLKQSFSSNYIIQQDMRPEMRDNIGGMFNVPTSTAQVSKNPTIASQFGKQFVTDTSAVFQDMYQLLFKPKEEWDFAMPKTTVANTYKGIGNAIKGKK